MRIFRPLLLATGLLSVVPAVIAQEADRRVGQQLDALGHNYEIDEDGDYRMTFDVDGERTQLVYVRSTTHEYGSHVIREIWSPGYRAPNGRFPAPVATRLLEDSDDSILGAWTRQGEYAMFVVKLPASASARQLDDAINAAVATADAMENELAPGTDAL